MISVTGVFTFPPASAQRARGVLRGEAIASRRAPSPSVLTVAEC